MIASSIGRKFLAAYNKQQKKTYSAKEFFLSIYYPLFFNHEKYAQWITNSPFVQGIKKGIPPSAVERKEKLETLVQKISSSKADASIAIGYPSMDPVATTSGQITNMELPLDEEDVYFSWIGSGLGVGIQGGMSILFDHEEILLNIFSGWNYYRSYLNQYTKLRGNQINTWNGQWLAHIYQDGSFYSEDPTANFNPFESTKDGSMEIATKNWVAILVGIALKIPNPQIIGYVYNLGQTNTTLGFIPFSLPNIRRPIELYKKIFGETDFISQKNQIEGIFGTAFGFEKACQMGSIGVEALEPKGLREYMPGSKNYLELNFKKADNNKLLHFKTYQIWILAMLKNENLWDYSKQVAQLLTDHAGKSKNAKTSQSREAKEILGSPNKKKFIEGLIPLINGGSDKKAFEELGRNIDLMPADNFPYFLTLVRFQYALLEN